MNNHTLTIFALRAPEMSSVRTHEGELVCVYLPKNCSVNGTMSEFAELASYVHALLDEYPNDDYVAFIRTRLAEIEGAS